MVRDTTKRVWTIEGKTREMKTAFVPNYGKKFVIETGTSKVGLGEVIQ